MQINIHLRYCFLYYLLDRTIRNYKNDEKDFFLHIVTKIIVMRWSTKVENRHFRDAFLVNLCPRGFFSHTDPKPFFDLSQSLQTSNMSRWWLRLRNSHLPISMSLWSCGHVMQRGKTLYLRFRNTFNRQT